MGLQTSESCFYSKFVKLAPTLLITLQHELTGKFPFCCPFHTMQSSFDSLILVLPVVSFASVRAYYLHCDCSLRLCICFTYLLFGVLSMSQGSIGNKFLPFTIQGVTLCTHHPLQTLLVGLHQVCCCISVQSFCRCCHVFPFPFSF